MNGQAHQQRSLAICTIIYSMAAAISNAHLLRNWHEQTGLGDPNHPLFKPDPEFHGFKELDDQEARQLDLACTRVQSRTGSLEGVA